MTNYQLNYNLIILAMLQMFMNLWDEPNILRYNNKHFIAHFGL